MDKIKQENSKLITRICLVVIIIALILSQMSNYEFSVHAATPTQTISPTPSVKPSQNQLPKDSSELEKIQKIKDIVASKVAELNLVEKRGIIGTVREVSTTKIAVIDAKGTVRQIDVDELTKYKLQDDKSGVTDIKKGETYSFVGIYNKESQRLLARTISLTSSIPFYFEGAITSVDEKNFQITLVDQDGNKKSVDIQNSTKTRLADSNGEMVKSGFSKLEINARVLAIGFLDKKDKNLISATRVIHYENVPPSKEMQSHVVIK